MLIKQHVFVVELKHILGNLINDDGQFLPIEDEIAIFKKVADSIYKEYPLFRFKVMVVTLK